MAGLRVTGSSACDRTIWPPLSCTGACVGWGAAAGTVVAAGLGAAVGGGAGAIVGAGGATGVQATITPTSTAMGARSHSAPTLRIWGDCINPRLVRDAPVEGVTQAMERSAVRVLRYGDGWMTCCRAKHPEEVTEQLGYLRRAATTVGARIERLTCRTR